MAKQYVVSACLAGEPCRYDGGCSPCPAVQRLIRAGQALPVCPETLGGLPTPRVPSEIRDGSVVAKDGTDVTDAFTRGAEEALRLAQENGCTAAILKARSPSCGLPEYFIFVIKFDELPTATQLPVSLKSRKILKLSPSCRKRLPAITKLPSTFFIIPASIPLCP